MNYSKYGDVSALLVDLCYPLNDSELEVLARVGAKMSNDKEFERVYTQEVKRLYLENLQSIQNNTYRPKRFEQLNFDIYETLSSFRGASSAVLFPEYAVIDDADRLKEEKDKVVELQARIVQLKKQKSE